MSNPQVRSFYLNPLPTFWWVPIRGRNWDFPKLFRTLLELHEISNLGSSGRKQPERGRVSKLHAIDRFDPKRLDPNSESTQKGTQETGSISTFGNVYQQVAHWNYFVRKQFPFFYFICGNFPSFRIVIQIMLIKWLKRQYLMEPYDGKWILIIFSLT